MRQQMLEGQGDTMLRLTDTDATRCVLVALHSTSARSRTEREDSGFTLAFNLRQDSQATEALGPRFLFWGTCEYCVVRKS